MGKQASRWAKGPPNGITEDVSTDFNSLNIPLSKTFERPHGPPQKIDLEFLNTRPQIAQVFADTFWLEVAPLSDLTRRNRVSYLRAFSAFLDWTVEEGGVNTTTLREFTFELLGDFAKWLVEERNLSENSAQSTFGGLAQHLIGARRLHPQEFQSDFEIPANRFCNARLEGGSRS